MMASRLKLDSPTPSELHSPIASRVDEAIEQLVQSSNPEASRTLIRYYRECGWREARIKIIRVLGQHPRQRHLEFLFRLSLERSDTSIAQAAIEALGSSHHPLAARFLNHLYQNCSDELRPSVVAAIGEIPDRTLSPELLAELQRSLKSGSFLLTRNLILTLGELKVAAALPTLEWVIRNGRERRLALAALIAIGKVGRNRAIFDECEGLFRSDLQEQQVFQIARTQVHFRSHWALEDYLGKLFGEAAPHPSLPFELNAFRPEDVREGLKLYSGPAHLERLCLALSKLDFAGIENWYFELMDLEQLNTQERALVLSSISWHHRPEMIGVLDRLRGSASTDTPPDWLQAVSLAVPDADQPFRAFFSDPGFVRLDDDGKVEALNHLVNFGLATQMIPQKMHEVGRILEGVLDRETSVRVRGRILRAAGTLGIHSPRITAALKRGLEIPELVRSCLNAIENLGPVASSSVQSTAKLALERIISDRRLDGERAPLFRALSGLDDLFESAHLDRLIAEALAPEQPEETRLAALRLLARHPRGHLVRLVLSALKSPSEQVVLDAIIALESLQDPESAEPLAEVLQSPFPPIAGRALHTLTLLPGLRAKRLVMDHLKSHPLDDAVCEKVCRGLKAPESGFEYFVAVIRNIIAEHPEHPRLDQLEKLRERIASAAPSALSGALQTADIAAIDRDLSERIPGYAALDATVQSALRSAEVTANRPELFDETVDKSASIVEYCKAIDLILERSLGKRLLFPKLERSLHEFQNVIHAAELNAPTPAAERVLQRLGLETHFTVRSFPIHKMGLIAQSILNGRILDERFNTIDGLRAWAMILLLFGRNATTPDHQVRALIPLKSNDDGLIVQISRTLMSLQDSRNLAAHRQTLTERKKVEEVRKEAFALLVAIQKLF
jgi:HEAT repeat protein